MRFGRGLFVVLCVTLGLTAVTASAGNIDVKHRLLDNGLNVYVLENHNAPVFTMRVYIRAGSVYEQEFLGRGISHNLEHLVAGGSTYKRTEEDGQRIIRAIGGAANAYTTSGHTCYYISMDLAGCAFQLEYKNLNAIFFSRINNLHITQGFKLIM